MKKNLLVFGTRPEAIKMAPIIRKFQSMNIRYKVCITAQHREMLDQVLDFFQIVPDYDLNVMQHNQSLHELTAKILIQIKAVLDDYRPENVFVHGDTTTTLAASLASFYSGARLFHVEAGLRTYNKFSPFPEEINRIITSSLADIHFAPTEIAKQNLLREHVKAENIVVTGNTVIDSLLYSVKNISEENKIIRALKEKISADKKLILLTGHRRENFGDGFINICNAIRRVAKEFQDEVQIIYPVHLNPNVRKPVYEILSGVENVLLENPLDYEPFIWLLNKCYIVVTDSGGIQEEAPSLGKPVVVMRDTTERPEAVDSGTVILAGTKEETIYNVIKKLLVDEHKYNQMSSAHNPYGDGFAADKIADYILKDA